MMEFRELRCDRCGFQLRWRARFEAIARSSRAESDICFTPFVTRSRMPCLRLVRAGRGVDATKLVRADVSCSALYKDSAVLARGAGNLDRKSPIGRISCCQRRFDTSDQCWCVNGLDRKQTAPSCNARTAQTFWKRGDKDERCAGVPDCADVCSSTPLISGIRTSVSTDDSSSWRELKTPPPDANVLTM